MYHSFAERTREIAQPRVYVYCLLAATLAVGYGASRGITWVSSAEFHTILEVIATLLAFMVGVLALVRFYSKRDNTILFIGAAFLGTGLLDGFHAVVTSTYFKPMMPNDLPHLIPWSWVASRLFLAVLLWLSWLAWKRERRLGAKGRISELGVYVMIGALTLTSFAFFIFVPLPRAYYPEFIFHRPEEFVPAFFFLLALIGYLRKGEWRTDPIEHWLVMSLIIGFMGQAAFMSFSGRLFDLNFDLAHNLKAISYVVVLAGLMISIFSAFKDVEVSKRHLAKANKNLRQEISVRKKAKIETAEVKKRLDDAIENMSGGFMMLDADYRVIVCNRRFRALYPPGADMIELGADYWDIVRFELAAGTVPAAVGGEEKWIEDRRERHHQKSNIVDEERILSDGRWLRVQERRTTGGGTVVIRTDITSLKDRELELKRSNEELERFAYVASHDLQEPLRKVQAFGDRLRHKYSDELPQEGQDYIERMQNAAARMQILIGDLLTFARIASKGDNFESVDLTAVVSGVVEDLEALIFETGGKVEIGKLPTIDADPAQIRQLFQNLIGNALKFHNPGEAPLIRIRASNGNSRSRSKTRGAETPMGECEITVKDNGIGFERVHGDKIFEIFQRLHGRDEYEGTGVGLAICRRIVERHRGTIAAESKPGKGATFRMRLPIQQRQKVSIDEAA